MRKINVLTFLSLDGVMQGPGGPEEDTSNGFRHGGWSFGYFDDFVGQDIFASYWPQVGGPIGDPINNATKYVATNRPLTKDWNTVRLEGDLAEAIRQLKTEAGPELQVHGSGALIQTLLKHDLVDELWLKIFPVTIGVGRRLFAEGTAYAGFALVESSASPSGVILAKYRRAGEVKSGSFALPT